MTLSSTHTDPKNPIQSEAAWMTQLRGLLCAPDVLLHDAFWDSQTGLVVSTDTLVEDVHFKRDWTTPYALGVKTAEVNLSDLATTLATPRGLLLNLSLPKNVSPEMLTEFYRGVQDALAPYGAAIWGGDTTASPHWVITATAIGAVQANNPVGRRDAAKAGDAVYYFGPPPGQSHAALRALQAGQPQRVAPETLAQHHTPKAQVKAAFDLRDVLMQGFEDIQAPLQIALMDTSDGLANAACLLAAASNIDIVLRTNTWPQHPDVANWLTPEDALYGGEDYGLVCTLPEDFNRDLTRFGWSRIGYVQMCCSENTPQAWLEDPTHPEMPRISLSLHKGFQHFSGGGP